MLGQRTMAGLTVDACMLASLFHVRNFSMARFAGILTCKVDRKRSDVTNGGAAVVAIFSEALRHNEVSNH